MFKSLVVFFSLAGIPVFAAEQLQSQAPPVGFSGTLVKYGNDSVTLKDKDGKEVVLAMTNKWTVSKPREISAVDISKGDFIASQNKPVDATTGTSTELRIMEPGYRPEFGTHLMGQSGNAMTHGTVDGIKTTAEGVVLDVSYPDGSRHLVIPAGVKVTKSELLKRKVLKPGTQVGAVARKGADGVLRAGRLTLQP